MPRHEELRHDTPARRFKPHLQAFRVIEPAHPLDVDGSAVAPQQDMNAAISITRMRLSHLPNGLAQRRLAETGRAVVVGRPVPSGTARQTRRIKT